MSGEPVLGVDLCPHCGKAAQTLATDSHVVYWCEAGHVSTSRDNGQSYKLVDDMTKSM